MIASLCHVCHDSDEMPAKKSLCSYCTYCHILLHIPLRQLFFKVCVCVCVCFHFFCFWEWKMSCYLLAWGEFWDLSAVIINLYRVYLEVLHLSCPPLQNAKYSSLLDFITIFWYQLPCLFFSHKCLFFFWCGWSNPTFGLHSVCGDYAWYWYLVSVCPSTLIFVQLL
jgi:hypothetical protein